MEVSGQIHATAALNLEKETKIAFKCETSWPKFWIIREKSKKLCRESKQIYATVQLLAYSGSTYTLAPTSLLEKKI
jgi:hypothetical protein